MPETYCSIRVISCYVDVLVVALVGITRFQK